MRKDKAYSKPQEPNVFKGQPATVKMAAERKGKSDCGMKDKPVKKG